MTCRMVRLVLTLLFPKEAAAYGSALCWGHQMWVAFPQCALCSCWKDSPFALKWEHPFQPKSAVAISATEQLWFCQVNHDCLQITAPSKQKKRESLHGRLCCPFPLRKRAWNPQIAPTNKHRRNSSSDEHIHINFFHGYYFRIWTFHW